MEKIDPYLKYLNIVLTVVIITTIIILYVFISRINLFYAPNYEILLIILPCVLGGIAAGLITPGIRGIIAAVIVGALSFCIWSTIYIMLQTILIGTDLGSPVLLVVFIPVTLAIGGILGIIGGIIGFFINISGLMRRMISLE